MALCQTAVAMPRPFLFQRSWQFEAAPDVVWEAVCRTDQFSAWWSWLRSFDAPVLAEGVTARCTIGPPLPYALHVEITVEELITRRLIRTTVAGDLAGPARLTLAPAGEGTEATLDWALSVTRPLLVGLARVARPALEWGHEWVVRTGVAEFQAAALGA